jgi:transcriptional regulator with XRE-family HTH domain
MSPRTFANTAPIGVERAETRLWVGLGLELRDARIARRWTVAELAGRAGVSTDVVYLLEAGRRVSTQAALRIVNAFGLRLEFALTDPRRRPDARPSLSVDPVHSAMGELEAARMRGIGIPVGVDEPYQHYQFAGRADLVAWDLERRALLHIENRTRVPDFQDAAGTYNAKRSYLGGALAERIGVPHWTSETHVIAALWSSEVLHALRRRRESFRSICPDPDHAFHAWWAGQPPTSGRTSILVVLDPLARGRQRRYVGLEEAMSVKPRYRGYADAAAALVSVDE